MQQKYSILLALLLATFTLSIRAQDIPLGSWRTHLTYYNAQAMEPAANRIYVASENGFFYYDLTDNTLNTLSKEDGLSDISISSLAYDDESEFLVIGYKNGNIDLFSESEIVNIRSILNSITFSEKEIRAIAVSDGEAFLGTPFGVSVVDLTSPRIQESYLNIGENGSKNGVYDVAIFRDSLFLATDQGLWAASLSPTVNRLDFANWRAVVRGVGVRHIEALGNNLYYTVEQDGLFKYNGAQFQVASFGRAKSYRGLSASNNQILLFTEGTIFISDENLNAEVRTGEKIGLPVAAFFDEQNTLWVADTSLGLVQFQGNNAENVFPSGPFSPSVYRIESIGEEIIAVAGGANETSGVPFNTTGSFNVFANGVWSNYAAIPNEVGATQLPSISDLSSVAASSNGKYYFGSFSGGLLEWQTADNSFRTLSGLPLSTRSGQNIAIGGVATDFDGTVWVSNYGVNSNSPSLHSLNANGEWTSFQFNNFAARFPRDIIVDDFNQKWVRLSGLSASGILVFQDQTNFRFLGEGVGNGDLPSAIVNCLAKDRNGSIWVGTDRGVAEFFDPFNILSNSASDIILPRFEGLPLLRDENVTSIAVDGGNRKWIGTKNGIWLFSAEGSQLIHHFTEDNSPLLSDVILDVAIQPNTGEVFIGTDRGIISYRSDATAASELHSNVKIFPNPVRPNFSGVVSISGLAQDAIVKITDITGKMIWETRAQGGTATWNTLDYNGRKAKTGVYLVFSASSDGEQTFVGKLALVE